jgi:AraC-like DNA-binding protein
MALDKRVARPGDTCYELAMTFQTLKFIAGWRHRLPAGPSALFHSHAYVEIVYHHKGAGTTRVKDGGAFTFKPGYAVVYPPRVRHDQVLRRAGEDWCVLLGTDKPLPKILRSCLLVPGVKEPWLLADLEWLTRVQQNPGAMRRAALDLRASALLAGLLQKAEDRLPAPRQLAGEYAEQAAEYVLKNCRDVAGLGEVAAHVKISPDHLRHAFKRRYGIGAALFLARARVELAKNLLAHSGLPQKAVASEAGFATERYFSHVFHKIAMCTPGAYRQAHQAR